MTTKINSMNDALAFLLQGLYFTEAKLKEEFPSCCSKITSVKIRKEIENYSGDSDNKMLKLERVFNYLMKEPLTRLNAVINDLINETNQQLESTQSTHLRDILVVGCVQNINAYKISNYRSACRFAVELELDTVIDLLEQILKWEIDTKEALSGLAVEEFNRIKIHQQN